MAQQQPYSEYFRKELENGLKLGSEAARFEQYLAEYNGAKPSVYVADLIDEDGSGKNPRWESAPGNKSPNSMRLDGGFTDSTELAHHLELEMPKGATFRLITVDACSTEAIQILGHKYDLDPRFFYDRAYSGRKSNEARLQYSERRDRDGLLQLHSHTTVEVIDYTWLDYDQPPHLHPKESDEPPAFRLETAWREAVGDKDRLAKSVILWRQSIRKLGSTAAKTTPIPIQMAAMPRNISFYLIQSQTSNCNTCIIFLETMSVSPDSIYAMRKTPLSACDTVMWQKNPKVRGMYAVYFIFDSFGCYEPPVWDVHNHASPTSKASDMQKLYKDGRYALCTFILALTGLADMNIYGWSRRIATIRDDAIVYPERRLAITLHVLSDDLAFHQERFLWFVKWVKSIRKQDHRYVLMEKEYIRGFIDHCIDNAEDTCKKYDGFEKRIVNTIQLIFNSATILEAQSSLLQNERIGFLTILATIFIPLSFVASVFGMNVKELDSSSNSTLAIFFAVAIPVTVGVFALAYVLRLGIKIGKVGNSVGMVKWKGDWGGGRKNKAEKEGVSHV